jgi:cytochrome c-type biogenesis protein CcmE
MSWSPRQKRFGLIAGGVLVLSVAAAFVLNAFQSNLVFFFTPTQILNGEAPTNKTFRIGGMVKAESLKREGTEVSFVVTDTAKDITVRYTGLLPDLFKEGKGVVAQGKLNDQGEMIAAEVLAKHDENYMPPEAQHALDKASQARAAQSVKP